MRQKSSQGQLGLNIRECQFCKNLFVPTRRTTQAYCSQTCQKRDKKLKPDVIAQIRAERRQGKSFKAIAKQLGVSTGSVHLYAKEIEASNLPKQGRNYILISPNLKSIHIPKRHLARFCRQFNLNYACIQDVVRGKQKNHKGWKLESSL